MEEDMGGKGKPNGFRDLIFFAPALRRREDKWNGRRLKECSLNFMDRRSISRRPGLYFENPLIWGEAMSAGFKNRPGRLGDASGRADGQLQIRWMASSAGTPRRAVLQMITKSVRWGGL